MSKAAKCVEQQSEVVQNVRERFVETQKQSQNKFLEIGVKPVWERVKFSQVDISEYITAQAEQLDISLYYLNQYVDPVIYVAECCTNKPGFAIAGGTEREVNALNELLRNLGFLPMTLSEAEMIFFLSPAFDFMNEKDIRKLKSLLQKLPVWERAGMNHFEELPNIFVLAGQAHTIFYGDFYVLNQVLSRGYDRLLSELEWDFWKKRKLCSGYYETGSTEETLAKRFYMFSSQEPNLSFKFRQDISKFAETLPELLTSYAREEVVSLLKNLLPDMEAVIMKLEQQLREEREEATVSILQKQCMKTNITGLKKLMVFYESLIR